MEQAQSQEEALAKIKEEFPELAERAEALYKTGMDMVEYLGVLESFY